MSNIPTVPFDPAKHVIACRENIEGRPEWVTLQSIVAAERVLEAADQVPVAQPAPADIESLKREIISTLPPPELSGEVMALLTELTSAVAILKADILSLKADVATHSKKLTVFEETVMGGP